MYIPKSFDLALFPVLCVRAALNVSQLRELHLQYIDDAHRIPFPDSCAELMRSGKYPSPMYNITDPESVLKPVTLPE